MLLGTCIYLNESANNGEKEINVQSHGCDKLAMVVHTRKEHFSESHTLPIETQTLQSPGGKATFLADVLPARLSIYSSGLCAVSECSL